MSSQISRKQFLRGQIGNQGTGDVTVVAGTDGHPVSSVTDICLQIPAIQINASCLSVSGTTCRLCEDECDRGAISFHLMTRGRSVPMVDQNQCNGCMDCAVVCPVQAVQPDFRPEDMSS